MLIRHYNVIGQKICVAWDLNVTFSNYVSGVYKFAETLRHVVLSYHYMYKVRLCYICCTRILHFGTSKTWQVNSFLSWATIKVMIFENACNPLTIMLVYNFLSVNDISLFETLMINNSVKVLFCPVHPDIRKIITLKVPRPIALITVVFRWCVWYWWNDDRKTEVLEEKTISVNSSATNLT
jgi:hypothetical protein